MTDLEFVELVGEFYRAELKRHSKRPEKFAKAAASKAAEAFRSSLIVSLATKAAIKSGRITPSNDGESNDRQV